MEKIKQRQEQVTVIIWSHFGRIIDNFFFGLDKHNILRYTRIRYDWATREVGLFYVHREELE